MHQASDLHFEGRLLLYCSHGICMQGLEKRCIAGWPAEWGRAQGAACPMDSVHALLTEAVSDCSEHAHCTCMRLPNITPVQQVYSACTDACIMAHLQCRASS